MDEEIKSLFRPRPAVAGFGPFFILNFCKWFEINV